jgi:hypothetical protein
MPVSCWASATGRNAQGREPATEAEVLAVLRPCPDEWLKIWPVDRKVGNVNSTGLQQFEVLNILIKQDHVFVAIADLRIKAIEVKGVQRHFRFQARQPPTRSLSSTQLARAFLSDSPVFNASSIAWPMRQAFFQAGRLRGWGVCALRGGSTFDFVNLSSIDCPLND